MAPTRFKSVIALEENTSDVYNESVDVLIRIAGNILKEPKNPKFRSISLGSKIVINKLLPASGAMECLFEMGFEEGENNLVLPPTAPLEPVKNIHDELIRRRGSHASSSKAVALGKTVKHKHPLNFEEKKALLVADDLMAFSSQVKDSFLKKCLFWCFSVLQYENYELQLKALQLIPLVELNINVMRNIRKLQMEFKKKKLDNEIVDCQELLLREVCHWFNTKFFTWVDTPQCTKCGFLETKHVGMTTVKVPGADRVEEYKCQKCNETVLFPRYNDPSKLLETRKGRCGEWASCFCLFVRALGWDVRLVFDETDHVWVEIYSVINSKWVHCDPCENAVDTPLMYECGWKKKLSYIIAYSRDEIQDVTWRYSCKHAEVLKNRTKCSEPDLVNFIITVRNIMLNRATSCRRNFVLKRTVLELVELMRQNSSSESEEKGRTSGSLAWRLLRGETSIDSNFKPYVWTVDPEDEKHKKFVLSYITSKDEYIKYSKPVLKGWNSGLFTLKSVFKKEEKDWKMVYLSRTENSDRGILSWKFDTGKNFAIGTIQLKFIRQTFETGMISCKLCTEDSCVLVKGDSDSFLTDAFMGSKTVELIVELFGGSGQLAWQHAQILRQPLSSQEPTFTITLNLVQA